MHAGAKLHEVGQSLSRFATAQMEFVNCGQVVGV
jgi:hypothetical protein